MMDYYTMLRRLQQRELFTGVVQVPDITGTKLVVAAERDTEQGLYKVYIDGRFRLIWTLEPAHWWSGSLGHVSYPVDRMVWRLASALGVTVLSEAEFRALQRRGYAALVKERMQG